MRTMRRMGVALLIALALSTPAFAQSNDDRVSLNAAIGSSFANVGTTFATSADLDFRLNSRTTLVGETGVLRHAPFGEASEIAAPLATPGSEPRVNAYHWNANLKVRPFELGRLEPYVTGGVGSFTADTIVENRSTGTSTIERRQVTDFATNLGAGLMYRFNEWVASRRTIARSSSIGRTTPRASTGSQLV
jgi:outer membrane protein with beta-barrel domain